MYKKFAISLLLLAAVPLHARADEASNASAQNLKKVREQIEREEQRLHDLKKNQADLEQSANKLESESAQASQRKKGLSESLDSLRDEGERVGRAMLKLKSDLGERQTGLKTRVVAIYKTQRRTAALDYLFHANSATDLLKRARYLTAVANYDQAYLRSLAALVNNLRRDQARLDQIQQERTENLKQASQLEDDLKKKKEQQALLIEESHDKVRQQEKSLEKLRASAEKFEKVIASITGGEQYQPTPEDAAEIPDKTAKITTQPSGDGTVITTPFDGRGLESLRGRLVFPVQGEVIQRFGKQKHEEFADMLFVKGLEVRAPVGSKVKAVAAGKIVLSQVLPGYGNVVIIDHGQRYYTLYGRIAGTLKAIGATVRADEAIAVLGETDYKGRNFYFELRVKGKATNPLEYFRDSPPSAKS